MSRKTNNSPVRIDAGDRVLIVSRSRRARASLIAAIGEVTDYCVQSSRLNETRRALDENDFDLVILHDLGTTSIPAFVEEITGNHRKLAVIVLADDPTLDGSVASMRAGACDYLDSNADETVVRESICRALRRAHLSRAREERIERLKRVCRQLNDARQQVSRQVTSLCTDLADAYQELSDQMTMVTTASEFNSVIRQELEIESLLRTVLEFLLSKSGPTNAAIYLPSSSGEFSLGAYVNYDCPKDTAEVLLDHLADVLAPRFEDVSEIVTMRNEHELTEYLGPEAHWLADSAAITFACHEDGECLAVVTLFRDTRSPFPDDLIGTLRSVSTLFARQLARVIHVHHRHLPKDQWGSFDSDDGFNDLDLAA